MEDGGQTDRVTALPRPYALDTDIWRWLMTLTLNPSRAVVMIRLHTKKILKLKISLFKR